MIEWLNRMSAAAAGRLVAWLIVSAITATSLSVSLVASWAFLQAAPWPVTLLSIAGVALSLLFLGVMGWIFLSMPIGRGVYGSKYLLWYKLPLRKISWDFSQFLGGSSGQGLPVTIHAFQPRLKINWGGISPKRAFITCKSTGALQNVLLSPRDAYVNAEAVEFIPQGGWLQCQAHFGQTTKEAMLRNWDGFEFVFEYDDTKSFRRNFSRREIEEAIDRFWHFSNPPPEPKGRLKCG